MVWLTDWMRTHPSPTEKLLKQRLADHIFWGWFGANHASHVRLISKVSFQPQRLHRGWWRRKGGENWYKSRIKKELESTGVKQLAEKLAMAVDLLKQTPHSEITDVLWGICVSICNLLLSMPFSSYRLPLHSSLLPVHPLPESPFSSFPKTGLLSPHHTMVIYYPTPEEKHLLASFP